MVQSVPHVDRILAELVRVHEARRPRARARRGLLDAAHDVGPLDPDVFWRKGPWSSPMRTDTDSRIGRAPGRCMRAAGLSDVRVDYVVVDTLRVPRRCSPTSSPLARWLRDALATPEFPGALVRQHFNEIIASILNPDHYAVWHVPIVSGVKPKGPIENGGA
jgi:hypothetical protein